MWLSILVISIFFVAYAVLHSLLAGAAIKNRIRHMCGPGTDRWYRLAYNVFAIVTLLPMVLLIALMPDQLLYRVPAPWRWLMIGGQLLAVAGLAVTLWQTSIFHFAGLTQLLDERPTAGTPLQLSGFYRWVRHPLYFFSLLFLWLTPVMTVNLLTTFAVFTLYFWAGSIYEEQRLLAAFGAAYRDYQRRVPRLIPLPGRRKLDGGSLGLE
jgi:protein-S-isoprenylcysteine O-methyltransferase Ste14